MVKMLINLHGYGARQTVNRRPREGCIQRG
jgi:hypothetical protein